MDTVEACFGARDNERNWIKRFRLARKVIQILSAEILSKRIGSWQTTIHGLITIELEPLNGEGAETNRQLKDKKFMINLSTDMIISSDDDNLD